MDWQTVERILDDFKTHARRVGKAGPYGADKELGRLLDYVTETPLLKDYIESCQPGISDEQLDAHLCEVVSSMGDESLDLGRNQEEEIARLWRMFGWLRNDIGAIRQLGYGLSSGGDGHAMIAAFGEQLVLRFHEDIAMHFRKHREEFQPKLEVGTPGGLVAPNEKMSDEARRPRIFISYAQNGHPKEVRAIVNRLRDDGIEVIIDQDNLKLGHDLNYFMEQTVNDPVMSKVLIMCDRAYTEKANARKGGVGIETTIISEEVYKRTSPGKFIPVVLEVDEAGNGFVPTFLKSLLYVDLSKSGPFGPNYHRLWSEIMDASRPANPELHTQSLLSGKEASGAYPDLSRMLHSIQSGDGGVAKQKRAFQAARQMLAKELEKIGRTQNDPDSPGTDSLTLPLRNACLQITQAAFEADAITSDDIGDMMEKLHGEVSPFDAGKSYQTGDCVFLEHFFNELFICLVGLLREQEDYAGLHDILWRPYFLHPVGFSHLPAEYCHFTAFRRAIPAGCSDRFRSGFFHGPASADGTGLFETRELPPCWTKPKIQCADLFLFQMSAFQSRDSECSSDIWFPVTATHFGNLPQMGWSRMISKRHCRRMLPLFGLESIDELKSELSKMDEAIKRNHWDIQASSWVLGAIPSLTKEIRIENIGSKE